MFVALFFYNQGNSMPNSRGSEKKWLGRTNTGLTLLLFLSLFSGDQILLNATAFHLNSRGPDSDLFFFPARVILFHSACSITIPCIPYLQLHFHTLKCLLGSQGWQLRLLLIITRKNYLTTKEYQYMWLLDGQPLLLKLQEENSQLTKFHHLC